MRVLVADPSNPGASALRKFLGGVAEVQTTAFLDEAVQVTRAASPDVIFAAASGVFDGEALCARVKKLSPVTRVVLVYPAADYERAPSRAEHCGADGFLVAPLKQHVVLGQLLAVMQQKELLTKLLAREAEVAKLRKAGAPARAVTGANTTDSAFLRKYMLLEVKRSRRYRYPVALLLVALDGGAPTGPEATLVRAEVLRALSELTRDIDLMMPFAGDRYLVFLSHTHRAGCTTVARRVVAKLKKLEHRPGGTASVGAASYEPEASGKGQVSFGGLVREATMALKEAQAAGGDGAIVAGTGAEPEAKPKRSRIALT